MPSSPSEPARPRRVTRASGESVHQAVNDPRVDASDTDGTESLTGNIEERSMSAPLSPQGLEVVVRDVSSKVKVGSRSNLKASLAQYQLR